MNTGAASTELLTTPVVVPVGELVRRVASALERNFALQWTSGEVSNLMRAGSGHWYFSLKDREAQVRCVMFRSRNQLLDWVPRDGDRVEARVVPGLYVARGEFQLQVEQMRRAGAGALFEAFLRIKSRLEAEGLFEAARKLPLPRHPGTIGIVTSMQAAALRDVLTTLARRAPHVRVIVFPTPVQGQDAPAAIIEAITAAAHPGARHALDVLLIVRGGGSIEDLWAFNDEGVARTIAAATIPIVTGVGHETDFTIADFVADVRAPTPTGAAELASPDGSALSLLVGQRDIALRRGLERTLNRFAQRIDEAARRLRSPDQRLDAARARLDEAIRRMRRSEAGLLDRHRRAIDHAMGRMRVSGPALERPSARLATARERIGRAADRRLSQSIQGLTGARQRLALLDPKGILARGYAIVTDEHGRTIRDAAAVRVGRPVAIEVANGRLTAEVTASEGR
jgi:exodeoxyribonuclease VII large subunit